MTRIALLSDIHANQLALNAITTFCRRELKPADLGPDEFWILGDTLGYGPLPVQTWQMAEKLHPTVWLAGNHDWYIPPADPEKPDGDGLLPGPRFTPDGTHVSGPRPDAWQIALIHRRECSAELLDTLCKLPLEAQPRVNVFAAHAAYALTDVPADWLESRIERPADLEKFYRIDHAPWHGISTDQPVIHIAGHTHFQELWKRPHRAVEADWQIDVGGPDQIRPIAGQPYPLEPGFFYHLNPGSVGFPRGREPRCPGFAILDDRAWTVTFYQVSQQYDTERVRAQMKDEDYPKDSFSERQLARCGQPE